MEKKTVQEVFKWLEKTINTGGIGVVTPDQKQRILNSIDEHQIDGEVLESLNEAELESLLTVDIFGQRRKLLLRIKEIC